MGRLKGRAALITGSDSGIGRATAVEFAREGAAIVLNYRTDRDGADEAKQEIEALGGEAIVVQADHSDPSDVDRMFTAAYDAFGTLDILVNNAAVDTNETHVADLELEDFELTMRVNVTGPFLCTKHFINHRKGHGGGGRIINVSSVHEEIPMPGAGAYDASKGALRNLMRTLVLEVSEWNITVNNIAPGMILTPINQEAVDDPDVREEAAKNIPLGRAGEPEEVAHVALFLASDEAAYVTGSTYVIDGGLMRAVGQGA